ncbi:MAG: hypothetical protein N2257_08875 [Thermodesulfovibrionales bacterium]|nr:hypothetical protein [Thermodesulfovibrionales bacterium]
MLFNRVIEQQSSRTAVFLFFCFLLFYSTSTSASLIEATVAAVEDEVITLSEFNERYDVMKKAFPEISKKEVIDSMINRLLLLREVRLSRISEQRGFLNPEDENRIIEEYIEIKIRASVRVTEEEIEKYYEANKSHFGNRSLQDVAEKIEEVLTEIKTNESLKEHIDSLRKKAYIFINTEFLKH